MERSQSNCSKCDEPFNSQSKVPYSFADCTHFFCLDCIRNLKVDELEAIACPKCADAQPTSLLQNMFFMMASDEEDQEEPTKDNEAGTSGHHKPFQNFEAVTSADSQDKVSQKDSDANITGQPCVTSLESQTHQLEELKMKLEQELANVEKNLEQFTSYIKSCEKLRKESYDSYKSKLMKEVEIFLSYRNLQLEATMKKLTNDYKFLTMIEVSRVESARYANAIESVKEALAEQPRNSSFVDLIDKIREGLRMQTRVFSLPSLDPNSFEFTESPSLADALQLSSQSNLTGFISKIVPDEVVEPATFESNLEPSTSAISLSSTESHYSVTEFSEQKKPTEPISRSVQLSPRSSPPLKVPNQTLCKYLTTEAEILRFKSLRHFYVRLLRPINIEAHLNLQNDMNYIYDDRNCREDFPNCEPGSYGAVEFEGNWRRCVVNEVNESSCKIFLVDLCYDLTVHKKALRPLVPQFRAVEPDSICCQLAHVAPAKGYDYSERANKEFKKLTMNSKMFVTLIEVSSRSEVPHSVVVYTLPGNGLKININAALAKRLNCVRSIGPQSSCEVMSADEDYVPPVHTASKQEQTVKSKRIEVKVLHIINPSLFFVSLKEREQEIRNLHESIQREAVKIKEAAEVGDASKLWNVGELCLVPNNSEFYRARVCEKKEDGNYSVFLIDQGLSITVQAQNIFEMPSSLEIPPTAIRMHLVGAKPKGNSKDWIASALDRFTLIMRRFDSTYVSIVGDQNQMNSFPVLAWGVVEEELLFSTQKQFHNILFYLYDEGLVDNRLMTDPERILSLERAIDVAELDMAGKMLTPLLGYETAGSEDDEKLSVMTIGNVTISSKAREINDWLPATPESVVEFLGVVTTCDENLLLSIRNEDDEATFKALTKELTEIYAQCENDKSSEIKSGHAVIFQNYFDAKFYRGTVEGFSRKTGYFVRFVDIGTSAFVNREDIYTKVIAAEIPALIRKYRLASIVPPEKGSEWSDHAADFVHAKIVDTKVEVNVLSVGDVSEVSINLLDKSKEDNIEVLAVSKGLARWRESDDPWPPKTREDPETEFKDFLDNIYLIKQKKQMQLEFQSMVDSVLHPDEIDVPLEQTKKLLRGIYRDNSTDIKISHLVNRDINYPPTRSKASSFDRIRQHQKPRHRRGERGERPPKSIKQFDLLFSDVKTFSCRFLNAFESRKIFVSPDIPELNEKMESLDEALRNLDESQESMINRPEKHIEHLCLVKKNNGWHRGMIVETFEHDKMVRVFLMDSAQLEDFSRNVIYRMPLNIGNFPAKILSIQLCGIKPNLVFSENDCLQYLVASLQGKELTAVVEAFDEDDNPLASLFEPNGQLAYKSLIDKNIYLNC